LEELPVPDLLVRDLDFDVLSRLKLAAKSHGRSLQGEIHDVLERASVRTLAETTRISKRWLRELDGAPQTDSTKLIRKAREER
jgi:plasmid stability protein